MGDADEMSSARGDAPWEALCARVSPRRPVVKEEAAMRVGVDKANNEGTGRGRDKFRRFSSTQALDAHLNEEEAMGTHARNQ